MSWKNQAEGRGDRRILSYDNVAVTGCAALSAQSLQREMTQWVFRKGSCTISTSKQEWNVPSVRHVWKSARTREATISGAYSYLPLMAVQDVLQKIE